MLVGPTLKGHFATCNVPMAGLGLFYVLQRNIDEVSFVLVEGALLSLKFLSTCQPSANELDLGATNGLSGWGCCLCFLLLDPYPTH